MLSQAGWLLIAGSAGTIVGGRLFGLPELYVLGATGLVLVAVAVVLVLRPLPTLAARRVLHPARVHLGNDSRVEIRVSNRGRRRSPVVELNDPVEGTVGARVSLAPLRPGQERAASYRLPTERRGLVEVGPLEADVVDPFGLARRRHRLASTASLTVLPAIESIASPGSGGGSDDPLGGLTHPVLGATADDEFAALRPYVVGDDLRRVHWPSTARLDDLVVRQDDPPWQGHLTVLLDARIDHTDPERFEVAVSAAASLLHAVAERGHRLRLVVTDGTDTGQVDARSHEDDLLELLAVVERHRGTALPTLRGGGRNRAGLLVVFTGSPTPADLQHLTVLRSRYGTIRVVCAADGFGTSPGADREAGRGTRGASAHGALEMLTIDRSTTFAAVWATAGSKPAGSRR